MSLRSLRPGHPMLQPGYRHRIVLGLTKAEIQDGIAAGGELASHLRQFVALFRLCYGVDLLTEGTK